MKDQKRVLQKVTKVTNGTLILLLLAGCETYQKSPITPDGFNYTLAVDHEGLNVSQHWFGFSWSLKNK